MKHYWDLLIGKKKKKEKEKEFYWFHAHRNLEANTECGCGEESLQYYYRAMALWAVIVWETAFTDIDWKTNAVTNYETLKIW